jgi:alpha-glucosidase (family GH31 glycosyl hydrolase)
MGELLLAAALFGGMALLTGDREGGGFKTITWQEFYKKMLVTGEVARLVVDADGEHVHVFLHDGAIIPGYNDHTNNLVSRMPNFRLSIASVRAFERHMQVRR